MEFHSSQGFHTRTPRSRHGLALLFALFAFCASACGTSDGSTGPPRQTFFQVSTLGTLGIGLYEGSLPIGDLLQHGDFGLGTFDALDGEMVVVDGQVFRIGPMVCRAPLRTARRHRLRRSPISRPTRFSPLAVR
jgi:hypothetical protein